MSDEMPAQPANPTAPEYDDDLRIHQSPDPVLLVLVSVAQGVPDMEMGITLTLPGGVVSGTLIGRDAWFAGVRSAYEGKLEDLIGPFGDKWAEEPMPDEETLYAFIHMKDARFYAGASVTPGRESGGMFWRGRLAEVSGWGFGELSPS